MGGELIGLGAGEWTALAVGAFAMGVSKTSFGGLAILNVAIAALVLPARESTGAVLALLLVGDVMAVTTYRRHANRAVLRQLFPWLAVGVVIGAVFVALVDDTAMRLTIGVSIIVLVLVQVVLQLRGVALATTADDRTRTRAEIAAAVLAGVLAGFFTMVANAAGAVMTIYFLLVGLPMLEFLGTGAWLFLAVNLFKLPFSIGLGLLDGTALRRDALLAPAVVAGAFLGRALVRRIKQRQFEWAVLVLAGVSAIPLLL